MSMDEDEYLDEGDDIDEAPDSGLDMKKVKNRNRVLSHHSKYNSV